MSTRCHGNALLKAYMLKFRVNRELLLIAEGRSLRARPVSGAHEQNYLYKMDLRDFNSGDKEDRNMEQKNCSRRES